MEEWHKWNDIKQLPLWSSSWPMDWLANFHCAPTLHTNTIIYTLCHRKKHTFLLLQKLRQMSADFHNSFTGWLDRKFAIKFALNISPHLTNVATLPCKTLMSENSDNLKHTQWLITNHMHVSVAAHLWCGGYPLLQTYRPACWRKNF